MSPPQSVSSYGPSSAVKLLSVAGDVITNSLSQDIDLITNINLIANNPDTSAYPGVGRYPANFEAVAAHGDVQVAGAFRLAASQDGVLDLLAYGSLLTYADPASGTALRPLSTGPSLVEAMFDPVNPLAGFGPPQGSQSFDLGSLLLHQNDPLPICSMPRPEISCRATACRRPPRNRRRCWRGKSPKCRKCRPRATSSICPSSGRICNPPMSPPSWRAATFTIPVPGRTWSATPTASPDLGALQNQGGLSLAGPGFFDVEAGRNLGPFVTAAADIAAAIPGRPASDPIGTGIVTFGNTVVVGNRRIFSSADPNAADPFATSANNKLARRGADIVALFGVGNGVDYQAVIQDYVNPATSTSPRNYLPALVDYLETLGYPALSQADAWTAFTKLSAGLQHIFADKVFVSELAIPGDVNGCCYKQYSVAYSVINTLFPAALGYTDNNVTGDQQPVLKKTGDLDLLHATIKTLQSATVATLNPDGTFSDTAVGGDVTLLGPGGNINVGTTALDINTPPAQSPLFHPKLSNSSLGILTLDNGAINTFTDGSVLVNQSRILTVQGGDILMWSSNGDLDAGRGAKTTVDFKPLSVNFDATDLQTINLNGLVSGAGHRHHPIHPRCPRGVGVPQRPARHGQFRRCGLRSSGALNVVAQAIANGLNYISSGPTSIDTGLSSISLSSLESSSSTGGQAARIAEESVAAAASRGAQTGVQSAPALFTVEVLGFGDCDPESGTRCPVN